MSRTAIRTVAALIAVAGLALGTSAAVADGTPATLANTGCCVKK